MKQSYEVGRGPALRFVNREHCQGIKAETLAKLAATRDSKAVKMNSEYGRAKANACEALGWFKLFGMMKGAK